MLHLYPIWGTIIIVLQHIGDLGTMIYYIVYSLAFVILLLHFTGWLKRRNMEWVVLLTPVAVFAVIILDYLKII